MFPHCCHSVSLTLWKDSWLKTWVWEPSRSKPFLSILHLFTACLKLIPNSLLHINSIQSFRSLQLRVLPPFPLCIRLWNNSVHHYGSDAPDEYRDIDCKMKMEDRRASQWPPWWCKLSARDLSHSHLFSADWKARGKVQLAAVEPQESSLCRVGRDHVRNTQRRGNLLWW